MSFAQHCMRQDEQPYTTIMSCPNSALISIDSQIWRTFQKSVRWLHLFRCQVRSYHSSEMHSSWKRKAELVCFDRKKAQPYIKKISWQDSSWNNLVVQMSSNKYIHTSLRARWYVVSCLDKIQVCYLRLLPILILSRPRTVLCSVAKATLPIFK